MKWPHLHFSLSCALINKILITDEKLNDERAEFPQEPQINSSFMCHFRTCRGKNKMFITGKAKLSVSTGNYLNC